jgi:hypothetical protein
MDGILNLIHFNTLKSLVSVNNSIDATQEKRCVEPLPEYDSRKDLSLKDNSLNDTVQDLGFVWARIHTVTNSANTCRTF